MTTTANCLANMAKAVDILPSNKRITDYCVLSDIFSNIRDVTVMLHSDIIFSEQKYADLRMGLYCRITCVYLIAQYTHRNLQYLSELIINSPRLETLQLSPGHKQKPGFNILLNLYDAIGKSQSLERIGLAEIPLGDSGLKMLIDALLSNKVAKVRNINLFGCDITDNSMPFLEKFILGYPSIKCISLVGTNVSCFWEEKIKLALRTDRTINDTKASKGFTPMAVEQLLAKGQQCVSAADITAEAQEQQDPKGLTSINKPK